MSKKILFLSGLGQGGSERQVVETSISLSKLGYQIGIITYDKNKSFYHIPADIEVIDLKCKSSAFDKLSSLYRLRKIIIKREPDYVISYITKMNIILGFIARSLFKSETIFIGSERNSRLYYDEKFLWRILARISYRGLNGIFSNNISALDKLDKNIPYFRNRKKYIINNIVDLTKFKYDGNTDNRNTLIPKNNTSENLHILVPGRITNQKNQLLIVKIVEELNKNNVKTTFSLIGESDKKYYEELCLEINKRNLSNQILIEGKQLDMVSQYLKHDIVLLPSLYEGLPNVILESLAMGKVCVISNTIDSLKNVIKHGVNGFFIDIKNMENIVNVIVAITKLSVTEVEYISSNARQTANNYSSHNVTVSFISMLHDLEVN